MKLSVRYARLVIMRAEVDVPDDKWDDELGGYQGNDGDLNLPRVFEDGIPTHVEEVTDYEHIWEVDRAEGGDSG